MSEDLAEDMLLEFLNAVETGVAAAKQSYREKKGTSDFDEVCCRPNGIKWEQAKGKSGSYERSEDVDSPDHKALLDDLTAHQGKLVRDGYFYWLFQNGSTVGRKKRN